MKKTAREIMEYVAASRTQRRSKHYGILIVIVALIGTLVACGMTIASVYYGAKETAVSRFIQRVVPLPVAIVSPWHTVSLRDFNRNTDALVHFYTTQDFSSTGMRVDLTTEDGQKRLALWKSIILDKLIEDEVVTILAKREGIVITNAQTHERVIQELNRYGSGTVAKESMQEMWGFTLEDFERWIVKPQLYRDALAEIVAKKTDVHAQQQKIMDAFSAAQQKDFAAVIMEFSDNAAMDGATDAAWFRYTDLAEPIATAARDIPIGKISEVIETETGFHIIKIEDRRANEGDEQVLLRHIIVAKPAFEDWLGEKIKDFSVRVLIKPYTWNTTDYVVDITDPELNAFADRIANEFAVDISQDIAVQEDTAQ